MPRRREIYEIYNFFPYLPYDIGERIFEKLLIPREIEVCQGILGEVPSI